MPALKITLKKSLIGYQQSQRLTARALGLGRVGSSVMQPDSESIRGMVRKLAHVVEVRTEDGGVVSAPQPRAHRKPPHGRRHGPGVQR